MPTSHLERKRDIARFRLRWVLAGAALLALALGLAGLPFSTLAASAAPAGARAGLAAAGPSFTGRPRRTPTPTPTHTPTPTPTATFTPTPSPTDTPTATPNAAATGTVNPGARSGDSAGSGAGGAGAGTTRLLTLLDWGLASLAVVLLALTIFVVLSTRRMERAQKQQPAFAPPAQGTAPVPLDQFHQFLPPQQAPAPTAPVPPYWMVEKGLLKEDTWELPAAGQQEPRGAGKKAPDGPEPGDFSVPR